MKSIVIGSRPLGPLGVVSLPVVVGGEVDPDVVPDEGDDAPVGHPRDPRLEVVHDSQLLGGPLVVIAGEVRDADSLPTIQMTSLDILHLHNRGAIHVTNKTEISKLRKCFSKIFLPFIIFLLLQHGQVHHSERDKLVIEDDVLQMLLKEQSVADSNLAKGFCSGYFWPDARSSSSLLR